MAADSNTGECYRFEDFIHKHRKRFSSAIKSAATWRASSAKGRSTSTSKTSLVLEDFKAHSSVESSRKNCREQNGRSKNRTHSLNPNHAHLFSDLGIRSKTKTSISPPGSRPHERAELKTGAGRSFVHPLHCRC